MDRKMKEHLEEAYQEFKGYMNDEKWFPTLHEMCMNCEAWCGKDHDYDECKEKACFKHFLGYVYLEWSEV